MSGKKGGSPGAVETINRLLGIEDVYQAPDRIMEVVTGDVRDSVFDAFLTEFGGDVSGDWFHDYFEDEVANRRDMKQDFTPSCLARLASELVGHGEGVVYEPSAGTGGMLITRWDMERKRHHPFDYRPSMQWFVAEDVSDRAIPFLLFNLSVRGCNANVLHIDSLTRRCKAAYLVENVADDMLAFSDVLELPRSEKCMEAFDIKEWVDRW